LQQSSNSGSKDTETVSELTFEERSTINYGDGYIIVKQLHSKLVTKKVMLMLCCCSSHSPTGLESTQWTEAIDRGGSVHITDMFYQCLVAIEQVCKSFLGGDVSQLTTLEQR